MKGKTVVSLLLAALFALVFVLAVAGCSSVSPTADGSYRESRLATATTLEEAALEKLDAILKPRLAAATTLEEVWGVYRYAPYGSEVQKAAMKKLEALKH